VGPDPRKRRNQSLTLVSSDENSSDDELVRAFLDGQQKAFEELYRRYAQRLLVFLVGQVGTNWAEDLVQETFARLLTSLHRYDPRGTFSAYVHRIAANLARDRQRQKRPTVSLEVLDNLPSAFSIDQEVEQTFFRQALKSLSLEQRQVVWMHEFVGMTFAEIANTFGRPLNTVLSQMHRAVGVLRRQLKPMPES
jgi:RNA polymerase sigma-70 factor (ECF subfamily)